MNEFDSHREVPATPVYPAGAPADLPDIYIGRQLDRPADNLLTQAAPVENGSGPNIVSAYSVEARVIQPPTPTSIEAYSPEGAAIADQQAAEPSSEVAVVPSLPVVQRSEVIEAEPSVPSSLEQPAPERALAVSQVATAAVVATDKSNSPSAIAPAELPNNQKTPEARVQPPPQEVALARPVAAPSVVAERITDAPAAAEPIPAVTEKAEVEAAVPDKPSPRPEPTVVEPSKVTETPKAPQPADSVADSPPKVPTAAATEVGAKPPKDTGGGNVEAAGVTQPTAPGAHFERGDTAASTDVPASDQPGQAHDASRSRGYTIIEEERRSTFEENPLADWVQGPLPGTWRRVSPAGTGLGEERHAYIPDGAIPNGPKVPQPAAAQPRSTIPPIQRLPRYESTARRVASGLAVAGVSAVAAPVLALGVKVLDLGRKNNHGVNHIGGLNYVVSIRVKTRDGEIGVPVSVRALSPGMAKLLARLHYARRHN